MTRGHQQGSSAAPPFVTVCHDSGVSNQYSSKNKSVQLLFLLQLQLQAIEWRPPHLHRMEALSNVTHPLDRFDFASYNRVHWI